MKVISIMKIVKTYNHCDTTSDIDRFNLEAWMTVISNRYVRTLYMYSIVLYMYSNFSCTVHMIRSDDEESQSQQQ